MPIRLTESQVRRLVREKPNSAIKRARKMQKAPNPASEADIQCLIVDWLRRMQYTVSEIGQYIESQRAVNDVGYPDLSIHHKSWPRGMAILMECKVPKKGVVSAAQKEFYDEGGSYIVTSLEEAQAALKEFISNLKKQCP